jgi:uncharacterized membrane protein
MNKNRLEAFSDGVLAILITIMVIELKVPHGSDWADLKPLASTLTSYVLSFVFVGIYWANHHHLLHSLKQVNTGIIWANMHLLFWLSLIPFVTGWMGENQFASNTVAVYGSLMLVTGIAFTILQKCVERSALDLEALKLAFVNLNRKGKRSVAGYVLAIPLAFVNPVLSGILFLSVAIMWLVPERNIEKALKE